MSLFPVPIFPFSQQSFYPYSIANACWFDGTADYMSKTFGGSGTRTTWTISVWVKRCVADQNHMIWSAGSNGFAWFQSNNTIQWSFTSGGVQLVTTRLFRDVGSWMHLLFVADTPDGTSTERMRLYVNGVREAVSFTSTPSASQSGDWFNSANTHYIGRYTTPYYAQMFMANFQCVDGTDLSPSSFGEFKSGIWIPKSYSGSYGTRGFFLDFGNSADLDADVSGNGNDFTATSMSAANQVVDTPTNNEAVIDTLQSKSTGWTSIGAINLQAASTNRWFIPTWELPSSGKWYFEVYIDTMAGDHCMVGIGTIDAPNGGGSTSDFFRMYRGSAQKMYSSFASYGATYTTGAVIGVAVDMDTGGLTFYKNNTSQGVAFSADSFANSKGWHPMMYHNDYAATTTFRFQTASLSYSPPSGYLPLDRANLYADEPPDESLDHVAFAPILYTGNGTAIGSGGKVVTGLGFEPDIVWIKGRSGATSHHFFTSLQGATKYLLPDVTNAEATSTESLTAFGSDGFTLGNLAGINSNTATYVAWCWKLGTAFSGSTTGLGTSKSYSGEYNLANGVAAILYQGNGTAGHTIPLPSAMTSAYGAPKMILTKDRSSSAQEWCLWHEGLPSAAYMLQLDASAAQSNAANWWNSVAPSSSIITLGDAGRTNFNNDNFIMLVFWEVPGFSAPVNYLGNGSSDGPSVHMPFRPGWMIVKTKDGNNSWGIFDKERDGYNVDNDVLYPDVADSEPTTDYLDILSNGIKIRSTAVHVNNSSQRYVGWTFADQPIKYSNAR